ncbi:O-methyltransferase [Alphaproteobacteria bacterium]|nr:O-methyltransferase [Alphaproteobacteria bacterium]
MTIPHYARPRNGLTRTAALEKAHDIAFYPMMFQAVRAMLAGGLLERLPLPPQADYATKLLLEVAEALEIAEVRDGLYHPTALAAELLGNEAVRVNMAFMNDVCYQGASSLAESLASGKPAGLKALGGWATIYEGLGELPEPARSSWFAFDNFYSDLVFPEAAAIVLKAGPALVYDIGGNTAKFDRELLRQSPDVRSVIFDLPQQIALARQTMAGQPRVAFRPCDILKDELPHGADAVWLSQFLDCFAPADIIGILRKARAALNAGGRVFILEPFVDGQVPAARRALLGISLYFSCMANGVSRMYRQADMREFAAAAGLVVAEAHEGLGQFDYTLLECAVGR